MTTHKNAPTTATVSRSANDTHLDLNNITLAAQRHRLLIALSHLGSINTLYARERLNIMAPAARIKELREEGHKIHTDRVNIIDQLGRKHVRVARYVLLGLAEASK